MQVEICGCLMQIDTTSSGAVLLNGDLVQAFHATPQSASPSQSAATAPVQDISPEDPQFPDIPF
jgi:hypothetical protein